MGSLESAAALAPFCFLCGWSEMREEGGRLSGVSGLLEERTPFELMSEIYTRRGSKPKIERDSGNMHAHLYRVQGVSRIQNQKWKYYLGLVAGRFPQGKTQ